MNNLTALDPHSSIAVLGASGSGAKVLAILNALGANRSIDFYDDDPRYKGTIFLECPIKGTIADFLSAPCTRQVVISIGSTRKRESIFNRLNSQCVFPSIFHPNSAVDPTAEVGCGCIVSAFSLIQPGVKIGNFVNINAGTIFGPFSKVSDFVTVGGNCFIASGTSISSHVSLGMGAMIGSQLCISSDSVIGSNSYLNKSVMEGGVFFGNPARRIPS